jgi:hypothetical protein
MLRPVHDVESVLSDGAFWTALVVAAVGTLITWLRFRRGEPTPGVAIVAVVAMLAGLRVDQPVPNPLVVALLVLIAGEWLTRDESCVARLVGLAPGAAILGAALPEGWPFWIRATVAVTAVGAGVLAVGSDARVPRLVPPLFAIGVIGVWACVPDTEAPKALLGAVLAAAVIGLEPRLRHQLGVSALAGLFAWVVGYGGVGRAGSVVGGIACFGVLVLIPFARWRASTTGWRIALLLVVQAALVAYASRVAGFEESAWQALLLGAPAFVVAWLVIALVGRSRFRA